MLDYAQKLYLPYTVIDVGWWYQLSLVPLPSGRTDYAVVFADQSASIPGDGTVPNARTDLRDIGRYVARIITDPRTLNKKVLAYNEVSTPNETIDIQEKLSGEKIERKYVSTLLSSEVLCNTFLWRFLL